MNHISDLVSWLNLLPARAEDYPPPSALAAANRAILVREGSTPPVDVDKLSQAVARFREQLQAGVGFELTGRDLKRLAWGLNAGEPPLAESSDLRDALQIFEKGCRPNHLLGLITTLLHSPPWLPAENFTPWAALIRKELKKYEGPVDELQHWKTHAALLFALDAPAKVGGWVLERQTSIRQSLEALRIGQQSPLYRRSLEGVMKAVASSAEFPRRVVEALKAAQEADLEVFKKGLDLVLCRFADSPGSPPQEELIAIALKELGDPRLKRSTSWGDISDKACRQMSTWISREDLELFFRAVAMDEDRRLFWLSYIDQAHYSKNVLGGHALYSSDPVLREYLKQRDRYAHLDDPNGSSAFILGIGELLIVEFSETGDACYLYDDDQHGIDLTRHRYLKTQLKNRSVPHDRILHHSGWQLRARRQLAEYGIRADGKKQAPPGPAYRATSRASASQSLPGHKAGGTPATASPGTGNAALAPGKFDPQSFARFVVENELRFEDRRPKGGRLWVYTDARKEAVGRVLSSWGFHYTEGNGWWAP